MSPARLLGGPLGLWTSGIFENRGGARPRRDEDRDRRGDDLLDRERDRRRDDRRRSERGRDRDRARGGRDRRRRDDSR